MKTFIIFTTLISTILASKPAEQYYREIGCKPIIEAGATEPTKYDCGELNNVKENQCYHRGKLYYGGQIIPSNEVSPCLTNCYCSGTFEKASINCIKIECPPSILFRLKGSECYLKYEHNKCCPTLGCDRKRGIPIPGAFTCDYEGQTYVEGEVIPVKNNDNKYWSCLCVKGFNGKIGEPWCELKHCDLHIHYGDRLRKGCVPTYHNANDFCPIPEFRCPSDKDKIEGTSSTNDPDKVCKFGKLTLNIGQQLNKASNHDKVTCSCEVPPHITCVYDRKKRNN